jgi:drug/metabolite transporter (DMT)-like permease
VPEKGDTLNLHPSRAHEPQTGHSRRVRVVLAFGAIYILWGATYLAIRIAVQSIPPFWLAGARFLLGGSVLYALMRWRGMPPPNRKHWWSAAIASALMLVCGNGSVVWAERRVSSGLAATLLAMIPLWMVLLDSLRRGGPRLTGRVAGGLVIGLSGVGVLVGPAKLWGSSRVDVLGALVLMFSTLCWAIGSLYSRGAEFPPSPVLAAAMEMLAGGAMLVLLGLLTERSELRWGAISLPSIAGLLYLVIFGSLIGFSAYIWLLRAVPVSRVATYAYVHPVVAVFLGWAIGGESISARGLLATGTIVAAVVLILSCRRPEARDLELGFPDSGRQADPAHRETASSVD